VVIVFGALAAAGTVLNFLKPSHAVAAMQSAPYVIYLQPYPAQMPDSIVSNTRP
jgi:hypothetical protein